MVPAGFLAEDPTVAQRAIGRGIVHANVSLFAVIHVEMFSVGRKGKPVGLSQIFGQETDAALVIQAVHALERYFLLLQLD